MTENTENWSAAAALERAREAKVAAHRQHEEDCEECDSGPDPCAENVRLFNAVLSNPMVAGFSHATILADDVERMHGEITVQDARIAKLQAEIAEARHQINGMELIGIARVFAFFRHIDRATGYCWFCDTTYPLDNLDAVTQHVAVCEKHPMRAMEAEVAEKDARIAELERKLATEWQSLQASADRLAALATSLRLSLDRSDVSVGVGVDDNGSPALFVYVYSKQKRKRPSVPDVYEGVKVCVKMIGLAAPAGRGAATDA